MIEFMVSFEIITEQCSLDEITSKIGIQYSSGSYNKGQVRNNKIMKETVWKLFSTEEKHAILEDHCFNIYDKLSKIDILKFELLPEDSYLNLDIGVLYDTYTCSIVIPDKCLDLFKNYKINIEVCCYPTTFVE